MNRRIFSLLASLFFSITGICQKPDTLVNKLDSLNKKTDTTGGQTNIISPRAYSENTKNEPIQRFAIKLHNNSETISSVSNYVTRFGGNYEIYSLAALGTYGFVFNNKKMQTTTLLATQAYLTAGVIESIVKFIAGRQRPAYYNPNEPEPEPTFHGPFSKGGADINGQKINNSFPSGHTTVVFAAATVCAMEYKNRPWIPIVSYSAASLVGLSRITENKHWATDVFVGATLGYLCGRQVVNNYHRYAKVKSQSQKKGTVSFNIQYMNRQLIPGLVYTFR